MSSHCCRMPPTQSNKTGLAVPIAQACACVVKRSTSAYARKFSRGNEMRLAKAVLIAMITFSLLVGTYPLAPLHGAPTIPAAAASAPAASAWPKTFEKDGTQITVYQPQLKSWEKYLTLTADTAIAITPKDGKQFLGVISWRANTLADVG